MRSFANIDGDDTPLAARASPSPSELTRTSDSAAMPGSPPPAPAPGAAPGRQQTRDPQRYHILGEHGRGGLGRVSRAHDVDLGRDIAIKELIARNHVSEVRFVREALITARLEHPGIVPIYEAGRWPDGTPFYAMKLVAGRSLRDLIAERTTVDERIALLHHVIAVADAIAYAHGRNIIHRDLKPANVVVGDFGETVVIDWGLAKDLSSSEESTVGGGPFREARDDGLTSAGSILGTPAYMAPEQERGEQVDQRADVYAIGAMLWELCALRRVPPGGARDRQRVLRRAGIDQDLAAIIDKALAPDPDRRYPDAGALAADLKAFKAGARIAARRYSPWAALAHWTRHHHTLAAAAAAVLAVVLVGVALYIRAVAAERDRADASEDHARRALDELTLKHAQLLLTTDPTAAVDALATYHGDDDDRARQIRADAAGRGVAILRARPHTDRIRWVAATPSGAILSLSVDGTLARTTRDGSSTVVAHDVAQVAEASYSPVRHLLAYACNPANLCFYDVARDKRIPPSSLLQGAHPVGISFSRDGRRLAIMSKQSELMVFDVADAARPALQLRRPIPHGDDVKFFEDDIVVANTAEGVEFVHLQGGSEAFAVADNSYWDANPDEHLFAITDIHGQISIMEGSPVRLAARSDLCRGRFAGIQFVPAQRGIAFACRDGAVGIWDLRRDAIVHRRQLEGHAEGIAVTPRGDHLIIAGDTGAVSVLDLAGDLVAIYKGHEFRVNALAAPTVEHPFVISADVRGAVRVWPLPTRIARVAATTNSKFCTAFLDRAGTTITATSLQPELTSVSPSAGARTIRPHEYSNILLQPSSSGATFATYGYNDVIELWSSATMSRTRVINTGQGSISQLSLAGDTGELVASGRDGRLVRWSASGDPTQLARADQPIDGFVALRTTGAIVFRTADGALWRIDPGAQPALFRPGGSRVLALVASADQRTLYAGNAAGDVIAIDTRTWRTDELLHAASAVQELSVTPDGDTLAVATDDGLIHVRARNDDAPGSGATWLTLRAHARHQALTSDGLLIVLSTDGTIWLYSVPRRRWLCLSVGAADLRWIAVSGNDTTAVAVDYEGRLISIDLDAARNLLANSL